MTYTLTSTDRDEITQRAVEGRPRWKPSPTERACLEIMAYGRLKPVNAARELADIGTDRQPAKTEFRPAD